MKKLILSLALVTGLTGAVSAQDSKPANKGKAKQERAQMSPEERAKKESERATKEFALTSDQTSKWETAALERIKANAPLREKMKGSTTPEERKSIHADAKKNMEKFDSDVNAFLTADQKAKWEAHKQKKREKRKQHKGAKSEPHPLDDED